MKKISDIVSQRLFTNAFIICKKFCIDSKYLHDVNFLLLDKKFKSLSRRRIQRYYDSLVKTDLFYSLPELFSTDIVNVPKGLSGVREYRFFSLPSMVLYNAVGLLFVDCCMELIENLNFNNKGVYPYYPNKFTIIKDFKSKGLSDYKKWTVNNNYKSAYRNFRNQLQESVDDKCVILKMDIGKYFEGISHKKLISLLSKFTPESTLSKHGYDNDYNQILEFYFKSLMGRNTSIPQGKKNFVSDFFGYLYLVPFDIEIRKIVSSNILDMRAMIRYVDDIVIVFDMPPDVKKEDIWRELLDLEVTINSWFQNELELSTKSEKTKRKIIESEEDRDEFLEYASKTISSPSEDTRRKYKGIRIDNETVVGYDSILQKFNYNNDSESNSFNLTLSPTEREHLKIIFNKRFQKKILTKKNQRLIGKTLSKTDFELTAEQFTTLIVLILRQAKDKTFPFLKPFKDYLSGEINFGDKRNIHLFLMSYVQNQRSVRLKGIIKKNSNVLDTDDYGKYLALTYKVDVEKKIDPISILSVYDRILKEYKIQTIPLDWLYDHADSEYRLIIKNLLTKGNKNIAIINQLTKFIYNYRSENWDIAFNHLNSLFHEICKEKYNLGDASFNINKITNITLDEELIIIKFFKRRNFNPVSHSSQKGIPTEEVTKTDLLFYMRKIFPITNKILIQDLD